MKKVMSIMVLSVFCLGLSLFAFASENASAKKEDKRIAVELKAMKERKPQSKCPVMAGKVDEKNSVEYMGYLIKTCCPDCIAAVKKDPLGAIQKIRANGEEPALAANFKTQTVCPLSGKPVNDEAYVIKNNVMVKFCCPDCKAKFVKDWDKSLAAMLKKGEAPIILTMAQTACPLSGEAINKDSAVEYKGKKVYFCCDDCQAKFNASPEKYLQAMADEGIVLESVKSVILTH
ncbi:MAG: YHS domain-containing protein [Candidatus Omnitrophota bacterium]